MNYNIPADVPANKVSTYKKNLKEVTNGKNRLMLFAGDQKVEHLNDDFYGKGIPPEDNSPKHMFEIASQVKIGVFATQFGLISRYAREYKNIPYLVKLNSKTNLIPYDKKDEKEFLTELYEQIHKGGSRGNGTGRNIHQRPLKEAIKMANAIYAITAEDATLKEALRILQ